MHQSGLSADLDSFDLLDLVQVIQMARRDLSLVVRAGSQRLGALRFVQGELMWAEFGALRGEEAFMALAAQRSGSIEERAWDGHGERNVNQPLSRLVMQAVGYRETHEQPQPARAPDDSRSRPLQTASSLPPLLKPNDRLNGFEGSSRPGGALPEPKEMAPEGDLAPAWVREIHSAQAEPTFSSLLREEMAMQIPEPTIPLSTPNGKFTIPAFPSGSQASAPPVSETRDDPPTVPLPSVQSGLRDYAAKRELSPHDPRREAAPGIKLALDSMPSQAIIRRPASAVAAPPTPPPAPPEVLPETAPLVPPSTAIEPKPTSLSILEQLAYGGMGNNGGTEVALLETSVTLPALAPAAFASAAPALSNPMTPAQAAHGAEGVRNVQQALEMFADQVGAACIATAVIRSDGLLLAEYKVRRGLDQDLASPAYHMAHVMQSSLRALLMGGWGDLEDTFITGSTHSVILRRLGRAEKGLFHVAVLERSGNPGLCRVRMRNNEAVLLELLSGDEPIATS